MTLWQAEDLSGADVPALSSPSSSSSSSSSPSSSSLAASLAPPQAEATNHTFKSLAFLGNTMDAFLPSASFSSSSSSSSSMAMSDGFAVAPPATEAELAQSLPIFDFGMPRNITGRTGHTEAIIKCRVDSLHDKSVIIPSPFSISFPSLQHEYVWQINPEFTHIHSFYSHTGLLDTQAGSAYTHGGHGHVHLGQAIPGKYNIFSELRH